MGIFKKIKDGLTKTRESISKKLFEVFNRKVINDEFFDELEMALVSSDVGATVSAEIVEDVRSEAISSRVATSEGIKDLLKQKILERIDFELDPIEKPAVLLVSGVNGAGKTTAIGKLALKFKKQGRKVLLCAADTFRAAAADQLSVWAERAGVRIVRQSEGADPAAVVYDAIHSAKARGEDLILVDTAGRLQNKRNLMEELKKITRVVEREYPEADYRNYIVIDATIGQNALSQVDIFDEAIDIDGIILTKLDGTAKGGVVIAICGEKEIPVLYVGVGEQIDDLEDFDAEDFVNAIIQ